MSKLDELRRGAGGNAAESMGAGVARRSPADGVSVPIGGTRYKDLAKARNAFEIPVDKIVPDPNQPRKVFTPEDLQDLSDSIRGRGLLQPIRARWDEEREKYVIVAGERRWRAAIMAGKATITCVIVEGEMDDGELLHDQLVENCLRSNLQPIEQAEAFKALMDAKGWSAARLAEEIHIRDSTVFKSLALLELPGEVRERVAAGAIKPATAYELSQLDGPRDQVAMAERVVAEKLTRDQAAAAVREKTGRPAPPVRKGRTEIRLGGGRKVTVSGLPDDRPETVAAALKQALRQIQGRRREMTQAEEIIRPDADTGPGEQAA
jgi:ParB family transcriptional regulator, chromosome partitioning protein